MFTYEYSLPSNYQHSDIFRAIKNSSFSNKYKGRLVRGNGLFVKFIAELTGVEKTELDSIISGYSVFEVKVINPLNRLVATSDPTTSNDDIQGFEIGSLWLNTTSNNVFMCCDSTTSTAVWKQLTNSSSSSSLPINMAFENESISIDNNEYIVVSNILYRGTSVDGSISQGN